MTFYVDPFKMIGKNETSNNKAKPPRAKKKRNGSVKFGFRKAIRMIKSFSIKQFYLNIDTGDVITNAKLYPVFAFFNFYTGGFQINFQGENQAIIHIQNRPINIIRSFFNF